MLAAEEVVVGEWLVGGAASVVMTHHMLDLGVVRRLESVDRSSTSAAQDEVETVWGGIVICLVALQRGAHTVMRHPVFVPHASLPTEYATQP